MRSSPLVLWPVHLVDVAWSLLVGLCALGLSGESSHVPWFLAITEIFFSVVFVLFALWKWVESALGL